MVDRRTHRGPHPDDSRLFGSAYLAALQAATRELSWLLDHDYAPISSLTLVGDRHALTARQRAAVSRCACAETVALERRHRLQPTAALAGAALLIDTFNVLTTLEVALSWWRCSAKCAAEPATRTRTRTATRTRTRTRTGHYGRPIIRDSP